MSSAIDLETRRCNGPRGLVTRREVLRLGALGLSLPGSLALRASALGAAALGASARASGAIAGKAPRGFGRAESCIVLFAWGGMSHIDTWDLKPDAGSNIRSAFQPIPTRTPGYQICEHLPRLAQQTHRMAIVRSAHHQAPSHRSAAYWNLTGHQPPNLSGNWPASRSDWPCVGSLVWQADATGQRSHSRPAPGAMPGALAIPYPMYDGGDANGQDAGFLGLAWDPVIVRPKDGRPYEGKSADYGNLDFSYLDSVDRHRLVSRRSLFESFDALRAKPGEGTASLDRYQQQALDLLLDPKARQSFDLTSEPANVRERYGMHICGQSVLMARKLTEAGVPLVTVYCAAGDLNGSAGAHWDTHGDGFRRLRDHMLPPLDQASSALLDDLAARDRLGNTLVVWLTEFGRTPRADGAGGRDHYPSVYSVAFAGAGIAGGLVHGSSNATGAEPRDDACGPADLHATILHALGVDPTFTIRDRDGRPLQATDGRALPIFG